MNTLILWIALLLTPYWVIVKNGEYLVSGSGDTTTSLSLARHFSSQGEAQAYMANTERHNPKATWTVEMVDQ